MLTGINRIQRRIAANLAKSGSTLNVIWDVTTGTPDPGTGALLGGTTAILSGTMSCFAMVEPARSVVREFSEVAVGDLIADIAPDATVAITPGQIISGKTTIDALAQQNLRFLFGGKLYEQKDMGGRLADIWDAVAGDVQLHRTLLLKLS